MGGISKPVNESLAKIFIKLGLIEQTGHGVSMIVDKYGKEVFTFLDNFLRVTIPFTYDLNSYINSSNANVPENVPEKLSDEEKIIEAIKKNPSITRDEMAELIGKTKKTVGRILAKSYRITRVGPDKGGH